MQECQATRPERGTHQLVRARLKLAPALTLAILGVAGCSHPAAAAGPASCGTARSAANVPVHIEVARGHVGCATAMRIERGYASAIEEGKAPGNGGGGPVKVSGWTCQGFSTPTVLQTGQASKCVQDGAEILAILPTPA